MFRGLGGLGFLSGLKHFASASLGFVSPGIELECVIYGPEQISVCLLRSPCYDYGLVKLQHPRKPDPND